MNKRMRQYVGIISAVIFYYIIHEGAHLLIALAMGTFHEVKFMGIGVQIVSQTDKMTDTQIGIFCIGGAVATFLFGYILVGLCKKLCEMKSPVLKAIAWYTSLTMLLLDPVYLGVLCGLFGGGDMNGIALLFPEMIARFVFVCIGLINAVVAFRYLLPKYTEAFK